MDSDSAGTCRTRLAKITPQHAMHSTRTLCGKLHPHPTNSRELPPNLPNFEPACLHRTVCSKHRHTPQSAGSPLKPYPSKLAHLCVHREPWVYGDQATLQLCAALQHARHSTPYTARQALPTPHKEQPAGIHPPNLLTCVSTGSHGSMETRRRCSVLKVAFMAARVTRSALRCSKLKAARSLGCMAADTSCTENQHT
jgi:hypothetical protein